MMSLSPEQLAEIKKLQTETIVTKRPIVESLEEILYEPIPVLDHGFIRVVDYMGDDAAVVQAARVSYGRGTKKKTEDKGLINYLMRHRHSSPFEMCEIKLHVKLPIFIARQWIRHRTANVNEYSARYSILDKEFYLPSVQHLAAQSSNNRQGRGESLNENYATEVLNILKNDAEQTYDHYEYLLNEDGSNSSRPGLARELARMNLPINFYTQWYWKIDLYNFMHFIALRADKHAQYEIRAYAEVMLKILKRWVPFTYEAFMDYRIGGAHLSAKGLEVIHKLLNNQPIDQPSSNMSVREWDELMAILNLKSE